MTTAGRSAGRLGTVLTGGVLLLLAVLVLGPVLTHRGALLVADMTFVPDQPWKPAWLGLDGGVPRAVPADAVVWALDRALPGVLAARVILLAVLLGAGAGAVRAARALVPEAGLVARLTGAALYLWNPYVYERLAIGHWGLLVGYAALPWAVAGAIRLRAAERGALPAVVLPVAVAAAGSPTGGVAVAAVVLALVVGRIAARTLVTLVLGLLAVNLPWLVPALVNDIGVSDPAGVDAFAARSDTPYGLWGSLLSFGGIWKESAAPGERSTLVLAGLGLLLGLTGLGAALARRWLRLATIAVGALLLAGLPATGAGSAAARWLVGEVPGAGLLRDSQKWLMPLVLVATLGVVVAVDRMLRGARDRPAAAVAGALVPVLLLPTMAWGLAGRLRPAELPSDWRGVRALLDEQPADQRRTAVLPWSAYQRLPFNDDRAALDPALRYLPGQVFASGDLDVGGLVVAGDDPAAAGVGDAADDPARLLTALRRAGVRFVLVERSAAGGQAVAVPPGTLLHDGHDLALVDLGAPARLASASRPWAIVVADVVALLSVLAAALDCGTRHTNRRKMR